MTDAKRRKAEDTIPHNRLHTKDSNNVIICNEDHSNDICLYVCYKSRKASWIFITFVMHINLKS